MTSATDKSPSREQSAQQVGDHRAPTIMAALRAAPGPLSVQEIGDAVGETRNRGENCRLTLKRLVVTGEVIEHATRPMRYGPSRVENAAQDSPAAPADVTVDVMASAEDLSAAPIDQEPTAPVAAPATFGGLETRDRLLDAVYGAAAPIGAAEVARLAGVMPSDAGVLLRVLAADGFVQSAGETGKLWAPGARLPGPATAIEAIAAAAAAAAPEEVERFAVEIPEHGHAGITDSDVLDEIEAEKVWSCAAQLRAANTAWGIDAGIDADVREARALMAEARHQVRTRAPLGQHYREGDRT